MNNRELNTVDPAYMTCTTKTDLTDFTFLMPLRVDSEYRKANADTSIKYILTHFDTTFIVVEGDIKPKYHNDMNHANYHYEFMKDDGRFFNKTRYINRLINLADTPFIAVWDTDAILASEQVISSAEELRSGKSVMSIPYDGRVYKCDKSLSDFFRQRQHIKILFKLMPSLPLMYGYHSTGGAYMADKVKYLETGGENENFHGWGPEDSDRVKRLEIMNLEVHWAEGPFFHLWHPRGVGSWYADYESEVINRREFINTCKSDKQ